MAHIGKRSMLEDGGMRRLTAHGSGLRSLRAGARGLLLALILLIPVVLPPGGVAAAARPVRKVALEGETAPGTGGGLFTEFDEPFVNGRGQVVFAASYTGGGVFLSDGSTTSAVVVSGQSIAGLGTVTLANAGDVDGPALNNLGTVLFGTRGSNTPAIVQKTLSGSLTVLAKHGDSATGTSGTFGVFDDMSQNNNDDVAFIATYTEDGGTTFKTGVFFKPSGGTIVPIVLNGATLPGTGGGTQCGTMPFDIDGPWLNDLGVVAFAADAICGGAGDFEGSIFVKRPGHALEAFVLKGDPAPASIGGTISSSAILVVGRPGLNNADRLAFGAGISGGTVAFAILTKRLGGDPQPCILGGSAAPDTTGTFSDFEGPAINQSGLVSVEARVDGDPNVTKGVFTCDSETGAVRAIALEGDPKPGTLATFSSGLSDVSLSDNGCVVFTDTGSPAGVFVSPCCPTCDKVDGVIQEVVVETNVTVDFNVPTPTCTGDPDLCNPSVFSAVKPDPTKPQTWTAIFDVGAKKLHVTTGTITTAQVPATGNNRSAPGIEIRSTCCLTVDEGGAIVVRSLNRPAGDIVIRVDGPVDINGTVRNAVDGTNGAPGDILIRTCCGDITTGSKSRIETIGQDHGGSDITLVTCCFKGNISIKGLVDASYRSGTPSTINIVSFLGAVLINGTSNFGSVVEGGTLRQVTSGVTVRSRRDPIPGTINIQAYSNLTVVGNTVLDALHPNPSAVAIKTASNGSKGGTINARSLGGLILASDRAFDDANRFNAAAVIDLQAKFDIILSVSADPQAVVSAQGGDTGQGGTNRLRSFSGEVEIGPGAKVLADFTGRPGSNGANFLISCETLINSGTVNPPATVVNGLCSPPAPDPLFICSDAGLIPFSPPN